jgi:hypothetical protein
VKLNFEGVAAGVGLGSGSIVSSFAATPADQLSATARMAKRKSSIERVVVFGKFSIRASLR